MMYYYGKLIGDVMIKKDDKGRSCIDYMIDTDPLNLTPSIPGMPPIIHKIKCWTYTKAPATDKKMFESHRNLLVDVHVQVMGGLDRTKGIGTIVTTKDAGFATNKHHKPVKWLKYFKRQKYNY